MSSSQSWSTFFTQWPNGIARHGIIITTLNDSIPFKSFWIKDGLLLLERNNPDALGGRFVLLGFEAISTVKFTDPLRESVITEAGFVATVSNSIAQLA
jgi:hypothetical protein